MPKEKVFVVPANRKELVQLFVNRVNNGVQYLDKTFGRGKWMKRIDLNELDLEDRSMCICGQAFVDKVGKWYENEDGEDTQVEDGFEFAQSKLSPEKLYQYGFDLEPEITQNDSSIQSFPHAFDLLTSMWIAKLSKLLK